MGNAGKALEICEITHFFAMYVWQSQVEIEHYSIAYFDSIIGLKCSSAELPLRAGLIFAM